jgi:hypothetical protein
MFLLAYAIMTEKTQALYSLVFAKVIEVLRTTGKEAITNIRMVSDFEFTIFISMETTFPGGTSRGCWFHFGQVSFDFFFFFAKHLFCNFARPNVQKIIKMLIALAILSADQALVGLRYVH